MYDINLQSPTPLFEQVYKKIIELVVSGRLKPNDQLPSVRAMAKDLGINPNTIAKAYLRLEDDKIIYSLSGRGSFIAEIDTGIIKERAMKSFESAVTEALNVGILKKELIEFINNRKGELA